MLHHDENGEIETFWHQSYTTESVERIILSNCSLVNSFQIKPRFYHWWSMSVISGLKLRISIFVKKLSIPQDRFCSVYARRTGLKNDMRMQNKNNLFLDFSLILIWVLEKSSFVSLFSTFYISLSYWSIQLLVT